METTTSARGVPVVGAASTLHPSARGKDEHALRVGRRLAPSSSRQACHTSRSFMEAAPLQTTINADAGAWSRLQALSTRHGLSAGVMDLVGSRSSVGAGPMNPDSASASVSHSSRKLAPPVGASWRLRYKPQSVQMRVRGRGGRHSPPVDIASLPGTWTMADLHNHPAQRRAPTLTPPPPRTVHQPQARPTIRSFMAARLQTTINAARCRCVVAAAGGCVVAAAGTHHPSTWPLCRGHGPGRAGLHNHPAQRRARTLTPPPPSSRTAAAKLAPPFGTSWRLRYRPKSVQMQVRGRGGRHSPPDIASPPGTHMDRVGPRSRVGSKVRVGAIQQF